MHVESTMVESALNVAAEMVVEYSRNGIEMRRNGNRGPGASPQGVYPLSRVTTSGSRSPRLTTLPAMSLAEAHRTAELGPDEAAGERRPTKSTS